MHGSVRLHIYVIVATLYREHLPTAVYDSYYIDAREVASTLQAVNAPKPDYIGKDTLTMEAPVTLADLDQLLAYFKKCKQKWRTIGFALGLHTDCCQDIQG